MKIAIISDIHANLEALEAVLFEIEKSNVDKIFCLGDLFLAGYDPNSTGAKIFELIEKYKENFEIIQGNTDKMLANYSEELFKLAKNKFPCMGYALRDDLNIIDKKYLDFIRNLPEKKSIEINNLKIELVHGSPRKQDENIYPNLDINEVEQMVENSNAQIILCGHTHLPCGYSLNSGKTVVNVGSVGRSMTQDKMPYWALLTINNNATFQIEHKTTKYDNKKVSNIILKRNFPHSDELAKMYLEN